MKAVQETREPEVAASAYVLAEALAIMLCAGKTGWVYEGAGKRVIESMYVEDKRMGSVPEQVLCAERTHVVLLNLLVLKKRYCRLIGGF